MIFLNIRMIRNQFHSKARYRNHVYFFCSEDVSVCDIDVPPLLCSQSQWTNLSSKYSANYSISVSVICSYHKAAVVIATFAIVINFVTLIDV